MAHDLKKHHITSVAVTPDFLRSEAMLYHFGVTEENWQEGAKVELYFIASETPYYIAKGIAALSSDRDIFQKTGQILSSWELAKEYGFTDIDGAKPDWGDYFNKTFNGKTKE